MPNVILAILIFPQSSPMRMDKARYNMVEPTPEPVKRFNMMDLLCVSLKRKKWQKYCLTAKNDNNKA